MRIRVMQTPTQPCIDGIQLDGFKPHVPYEVGNTIGGLFLAEGWAEPVSFDEAVWIPMSELAIDATAHPNFVREFFPPYYQASPSRAVDRRPRPRHRSG